MLVLFVQLQVMGLIQCFRLWWSIRNLVLSYLTFEIRCFCLDGFCWICFFSFLLSSISVGIFDWCTVLEICIGTRIFNWEPTYLLTRSKQIFYSCSISSHLSFYQVILLMYTMYSKYTNDTYLICTYTTLLRCST